MAEGRAAITTELSRVRYQLSPGRVFHGVVNGHKMLLTGIASRLCDRRSPAVRPRQARSPWDRDSEAPLVRDRASAPGTPASLFGLAARPVFPTFVKFLVVPILLKALAPHSRRRRDARGKTGRRKTEEKREEEKKRNLRGAAAWPNCVSSNAKRGLNSVCCTLHLFPRGLKCPAYRGFGGGRRLAHYQR